MSISASVAVQLARTRTVLAYGHRIAGEGLLLIDHSQARKLGQAKLHQQARENIAQQGEAAELRELGIFGHRQAEGWEDSL